jgi:tetratricopeptide (TPR) repeat protein
MMAKLNVTERDGAAEILRYLVTPSGSKIAQEAAALTSWTELNKDQVEGILNRLTGSDMRILRTMQAPGQPVRYEIFHDVLAQAVLNWRRRYVVTQEQEQIRQEEQARQAEELEQAERRREKERTRFMRGALFIVSLVLLIVIAVATFAIMQMRRARIAEKKADQARAEAEEKRNKIEALAHINKAQVYLQRKKFDDAVTEYELAISLDPTNAQAYTSKGYAQIRAGRYDDAIATLQNVTTKVDSSYALGHYNLALAYWKAQRPDDARKEAKAVLNLGIDFCETFKRDSNYKWFLDTEDYRTTCRSQGATAP